MPCCQSVDLGGHAVDPIFLGNADLLALQVAREIGLPFGHRQIERGRDRLGSKPAMFSSRIAQSRTSRAIGPAWSSDEAKATTPQREQRP